VNYDVIIEPRAERDIDAIITWIAEENEHAAIQWYERVREALQSLGQFPERCPLAPESSMVPGEVRQLLHGKRRGMYRILFTIRGKKVHVLHIRHGARDWVDPRTLE